MAALASLLPSPVYAPVVSDDEDDQPQVLQPSTVLVTRQVVPAYGKRKGWKPTSQADFGDGGAYPECHVAQYPLEMGKKKASSGNTLALQVDSEGNVRYDAIARQGQREGKFIQSQFKDLVPLAHRTDLDDAARSMERPSEEEVQATAERTRQALEKLVTGKIKAAQPKNVPDAQGKTSFIRYTPGQQGSGEGLKQRIIKMTEVVEDPLEPPRFKHKKIPRGPPSPPPPVMRSPPRKATAQEQKEWMIPPCISNWKNNKGFTIPLDKRLAADGRGLQDVHINDNFAKFSEALFVADRHAREEVRERALMQQKLAQKEKEAKEEHLRSLAQRARDERSGIPVRPAAATAAVMKSGLAAYGSDSGSDSESEAGLDRGARSEDEDSAEDEEARRVRDDMRTQKRREREREMRMSNMGTEMRAKMLARQQNRDISEKVALGLAKPTLSKEAMLDSRLFNQESLPAGFADEDAYNLYDRPLFHGSSAAAAIYKARGNMEEGNEESFGGGTEEGIGKALDNDRFGLGQARVGFEGANEQEVREGPVQFEKDTSDVFGVDQFLDEAKSGKKRGLDTSASQRVVTGAPVNLKERIAALQQRVASTSPQSSSSLSASPSSFAFTSPSISTTNVSGFALRERIAKFEEKGAVPVPRVQKRGELYGNRITSVDRSAPSSPPSALSRLGVNRDLTGDGRRSASTTEGDIGDGSPARKRCISTSVLEDFKTSSTRSFAIPTSATSDSIDEFEREGDEAASPVKRHFVSDTLQTENRLSRRNSVSGANALGSKGGNIHLPQTSEDLPTPSGGLLTPLVQDISEDEVPREHSSRSDDDDDDAENHAKFTSALSDQNSKGSNVILNPIVKEDMIDRADRRSQQHQVHIDAEDEDLVKTPAVSTFDKSSVAMTRVLDESSAAELSDIPMPGSALPSPFTASFEVGERAYHEMQKYVVVSPSQSAKNSIANRPDKRDDQISTAIRNTQLENSEFARIDETPPRSLMQPKEDSKKDTIIEDKENLESSGTVESIDGTRHAASNSFSESNGSSSRRRPPSPITIIQDKHYVEPSLELKTGPKSFHAVVHRKKEQVHTATATVPLPRTIHFPALEAQVITVRQNAGECLDPDSPGSPDLSALVAQALYLEQHLMDGQGSASLPPHVPNLESDPKANVISQTSQIDFPPGTSAHEVLGSTIDLVSPTPPPKGSHASAQNRESSRTTWSWSSGQASSEDSAPVHTPPSPTFDLTTPLFYDGNEHADDHIFEARVLSVEPPDEDESRRSISSILSSPERSARKKVLSISRSTTNFGRLLARAGCSSSTIGFPDDAVSTYTCDSIPASVSASISASPSVSEVPTRPSSPNRTPSLVAPLVFPSLASDSQADDLRPISVLSVSTASALSNSPLDRDLFDAFPAVPSDVPQQGRDVSLELGFGQGQDDSPQSPLPPTPPSKSPVLRTHPSALALSPPTPPSPNSKFNSASLGSRSVKSKSKVPLLALPDDLDKSATHLSTSRSHFSTGSSVFSAFSRSFSGRNKA
ncbi:hypothetical protein EW145_g280 [Phellinidium pouzarii]|uniref:Pre-mRNA-processing protein 45 n=1 Tax=Phellinidium pouzarii TaxID=167371 RepID=A0A4S4LIZ9_9AGAM|nr:hypothetical protein EW145_g280 [Phellinidium pouzarii]